jgi:hypothetical protein
MYRTLTALTACLAMAGCMAQQTPIARIEDYPVQADIEVAAEREWLAGCLHDEVRSGPVAQLAFLTVPMPEVLVVPRSADETDVIVQYFQEIGSDQAAMYRLAGSSPTRVQLHWPWPADAEGRSGAKVVRRSPHAWLAACVERADQVTSANLL